MTGCAPGRAGTPGGIENACGYEHGYLGPVPPPPTEPVPLAVLGLLADDTRTSLELYRAAVRGLPDDDLPFDLENVTPIRRRQSDVLPVLGDDASSVGF